ncbi:MAG: hypothetical protein Faunusvirus8_13 [Faunusvirus sp.]|jgi:hypothetical protein|uniref:Uncharacterized protein n=1 Tax=Faunusvirus sp. TaxID=2487766 RepID=A0A3G4ZWM2_9VIRU|nr:MAG: hypothetical protein Faunusvirus8_13 [Faunusvirus sp.]
MGIINSTTNEADKVSELLPELHLTDKSQVSEAIEVHADETTTVHENIDKVIIQNHIKKSTSNTSLSTEPFDMLANQSNVVTDIKESTDMKEKDEFKKYESSVTVVDEDTTVVKRCDTPTPTFSTDEKAFDETMRNELEQSTMTPPELETILETYESASDTEESPLHRDTISMSAYMNKSDLEEQRAEPTEQDGKKIPNSISDIPTVCGESDITHVGDIRNIIDKPVKKSFFNFNWVTSNRSSDSCCTGFFNLFDLCKKNKTTAQKTV